MRGNLLVSFLKFIIIVYLIVLLFKFIFPVVLVGLLFFLAYKAYTKRVKTNKDNKIDKKIDVSNESSKKDEYKNYIINELYILTEKCNSLDYDKKEEYLRTIKETLDEFTTRYDHMVDSSYESGLVLEQDTEEKIKMDFIERIVKLEEEINIELEKSNIKRDIHIESSKLNNTIGKKLNGFNSNQIRLAIK